MHSAGPTPDQDHLTVREAEMIDLIARGMSNVEIAASAGVSINSVKSFIRSAYRKIGAENRAHALEWAREHGYGAEAAS